jgi:hypothetical protein
MPKRFTIKKMQKLARSKGGKCLSKEYVNSQTDLKWRCKEGHTWIAALSDIKYNDKWCPICARSERANAFLKELQNLAKARGGECLSKIYVDFQTDLRWRCKKGHTWKTALSNLKYNDRWCPICARSERANAFLKELQDLAKARGGKCLSKKYVNKDTKLKWRCREGHIWETIPKSIKKGTWCPYCAGHHKTIEDMHKLAEARGGECLSSEYIDTHSKLRWSCKAGHIWETTPNVIISGSWCPNCARQRITIGDMQTLAWVKDGKCLSLVYVDSNTKLEWICKEGHIWKTTPNSIKHGSWCPHCAHRGSMTIEDMQDIAKNGGGKCLSSEYVNSSTKLKWSCEEGHEWEARPNSVKQGSWCPKCIRIKQGLAQRLTIEQMRKIATDRGGKCISTEYVDNHTKLRWTCKDGHEWEALPNNIKRGGWCPTCANIERGKSQRLKIEEMQDIAEKRGGKCISKEYHDANTKLSWQCKKGHKWERSPNNIKHGSWCPYCAGRLKTLEGMQKLAERRGGECLSKRYVDSHTKLKWRCKEGHTWDAIYRNIYNGTWCPICAGGIKLTIEEMQSIARERGGKCLSKEYMSAHMKLKWRCKEGHEWKATPANVKEKGTWCPVCVSIARANAQRLTIEEMQEIAKERGGECLSTEYVNHRTKLKWICKGGHVWEARPGNIKNGTWCPICGGSMRLTIKEMKSIARKRHGKCISKKYVNAKTKLKWRCKEGHEWEALPNNIKRGGWCPTCFGRRIDTRLIIGD